MSEIESGTFQSLTTALSTIMEVARQRGDSSIGAEADLAVSALAQDRFNVAFVGQFKRGKSTLINALLGREILPADVAPVTSAITVVQYGDPERVVVHYLDGRAESVPVAAVREYVSEEENPGNTKGIREVIVELRSSLLQGGMRFVDTPGIGSVFEPNTEVTRAYLPRIDVAVVVLGSDPPITGEESELVGRIAFASAQLLFVMNKADLVPETTRLKAEAFTREILSKTLTRDPGPILHTSGFRALQTDADKGMNELQMRLRELCSESGTRLAILSARRAVAHLASRLSQSLDLERTALISPVEELDQRIDTFQSAIRDIEDLMLATETRLLNEQNFDWEEWKKERDRFVESERTRILNSIPGRIPQAASRKQIRRITREQVQMETKALLERCREKAADWLEQRHTAQVEKVSRETNRLVTRVAEAASAAFGIPVAKFEARPVDVNLDQMSFDLYVPVLALDVNDWLIPVMDLGSPKQAVLRRACRRAGKIIDEWLMRGLYKTDEHMTDWIQHATKQLFESMRQRLTAMREEILGTLDKGRRQREAGIQAVEKQLRLMEGQRQRLEEALINVAALADAAQEDRRLAAARAMREQ